MRCHDVYLMLYAFSHLFLLLFFYQSTCSSNTRLIASRLLATCIQKRYTVKPATRVRLLFNARDTASAFGLLSSCCRISRSLPCNMPCALCLVSQLSQSFKPLPSAPSVGSFLPASSSPTFRIPTSGTPVRPEQTALHSPRRARSPESIRAPTFKILVWEIKIYTIFNSIVRLCWPGESGSLPIWKRAEGLGVSWPASRRAARNGRVTKGAAAYRKKIWLRYWAETWMYVSIT